MSREWSDAEVLAIGIPVLIIGAIGYAFNLSIAFHTYKHKEGEPK